ncbi:hypothetical protein QTP70_019001 [Hemibagrus guttatus]|uniref:Phospholipase A2 n=1 Tax=Hemibagrus guttatus TaxID=175788 RepID=A0AAE0UXH2_9TELE|nr:hypothetical protein QTP70_019001 [Hemibagrus guttatus]
MILCVKPDSCPALDYADYSCYCGSGTQVDDLDRCCQVHDKCFSDAKQHKACWPNLDNPYTETYAYSCDKAIKTITCKSNNNKSEMFICDCDCKAAECFAMSEYHDKTSAQ